MDEIFDKVKVHASKAKDEAAKITRQMVDKTNSLIAQTKLNFAVSETESKINEIYTQMGKKVYEQYLEDGEICGCMSESCAKLDDLMSEIADLREKLAEVKESVKCCSCGEYNKKTASYCSKCGESLRGGESYEEPEAAEEPDGSDEDYGRVVVIKPKKPETDENEDNE